MGSEEIVLASGRDAELVGKIYDSVNDYFEQHENYCYPNWQKGKYPVVEDARRAQEQRSLYVLKVENGIGGAITIDHFQHSEYKKILWTLEQMLPCPAGFCLSLSFYRPYSL